MDLYESEDFPDWVIHVNCNEKVDKESCLCVYVFVIAMCTKDYVTSTMSLE